MDMRQGYNKRTIIRAFTEFAALNKKGHKYNVVLNCGHWDKLTRTEIKNKYHICFDCFYGKPQHDLAMLEIQLEAERTNN